MDFGLVQLTETSQQLTRTGFTLGTPQYMAPEQARGDLTGLATDLYAFGAVLYRTLTGITPFEAENDQAILYQHVYSEAVPVQELNPLIPDSLARLVSALLEKEPAARPPSGEVVADMLRAIRESTLRRSTHLPLGGASRKAVYPTGPGQAAGLQLDWRVHLPDGPQWPGGIGAAEGLILLGLRDDRVVALHPADGSEVMSFEAPDEVNTAPVYAHGRLYLVSRDGSLQAHSWPAGTTLWEKTGLDVTGILPYGENLLVTTGRGTLDLLAPSTETLWSYEAGAAAATPAGLHRGQAVFHTRDGWLHSVDALSGKGRFKVETGPLAATPAAAGGVLLLAGRSGELHAFDMASRQVLWSHDLPGEVFGSPAIWQGQVYLGSWGRKLHCVSFATGDTLWLRDLPSAVTASPVIAHGTVYVACEGGELLAFSARSGEPLWQDKASHGPIQASPLLLHDHLIVAALDGTISAYRG
jgi:serine/threonine-protein kinase